MTPQQIFDQVVAHLREQKSRAFSEEKGMCQYRTADGKKCAVGCLLLDTEYDPRMEEGFDVGDLFHEWPTIRERLGSNNLNLLILLQRNHDKTLVRDWENRWETFADIYGLTYTPPLATIPQEDRNDPPG